jgi:hypothetical protein
MKFSEFYNHLKVRDKKEYYYYSHDLKNFGKKIVDDVDIGLFRKDKNHFSTNVWIGGKGSTSQLHWDSANNVYFQVFGKKRFLLFPSEEWRNIYLFPRISPNSRQSQIGFVFFNSIDFTKTTESKIKYPLMNNLKPIEVILNEGEILYMPAYTFHHVEVEEGESISINFWSDSDESKYLTKMKEFPIPFEENWNQMENINGLTTWIYYLIKNILKLKDRIVFPSKCDQIVNKLDCKVSIGEYLEMIIGNRFKYLMEDNVISNLKLNDNQRNWCSLLKDKKLKKKFNVYSKNFIHILKNIHPSKRDFLFGDYLEEILVFFNFDVYFIGAYFKNCF